MADRPDPLTALADIPAAAAGWRRLGGFVAALSSCASASAGWPAEIEHARRWYEPHLERIHEDAAVRQADLLQLEQIAAGYPSRERFLTELTLDPPDATSDQAGVPLLDEDYLILSTIHSAKGRKWKSVFVLNVVDGCIPSDLGAGTTAEIEEERRLLYVAMTRAKDNLHLVVPQRFFTHGQNAQGDRHVYASRTRFIPKELQRHLRVRNLAVVGRIGSSAHRSKTTPYRCRKPKCAACGASGPGNVSRARMHRVARRRATLSRRRVSFPLTMERCMAAKNEAADRRSRSKKRVAGRAKATREIKKGSDS